jgi:hypothetical protein
LRDKQRPFALTDMIDKAAKADARNVAPFRLGPIE